jgi:hypothetical protein
MLEKNFALCATEKINITTRAVRKKISERNKKPYFPPPKSENIFQQHWESEYFLEKTITPPPLSS